MLKCNFNCSASLCLLNTYNLIHFQYKNNSKRYEITAIAIEEKKNCATNEPANV